MRVAVICLASVLALAACSRKPASQASSSTAAGGPAAAASAPSAIFTPHRKAGLWQVAINASGGPGVQVHGQMCIDASTDKDFSWHGAHSPSQNCERVAMHPQMGGFSFDSVCHAGSRTITSHGVVSGDLNSSYSVDVTTRMNPPGPGGMAGEVRSQIKARWLGPCPEGMKPGSMKMGGMTIGR